jgi:hypothetical protein
VYIPHPLISIAGPRLSPTHHITAGIDRTLLQEWMLTITDDWLPYVRNRPLQLQEVDS